ncbi:MAG: helix-hairpin-helix domain-containing protein [Clostridia bacterium]|nr:helix-hairpin-helix domain-containing protein [Clostridia bacterium]
MIRDFDSSAFEIIQNATAYAPEEEYADIAGLNPEKPIVNINTAEIYLLDTLEGVGESLAKRIIEYRTKNGNFEVIQDIMKVEGIGEKRFEAIKDYIVVK